MKHKRNHPVEAHKGRGAAGHLEFHHPSALTVCVAGTFNDWRPDATPMISVGKGRWIKELVLPPGSYEYCLVVDGEWMPDPQADEAVANPFGGVNAVLRVPPVAAPFSKAPQRKASCAKV